MTTPRVRLIFLAILLAVPLAVIAWDVWLYSIGGTEMTISWSMATAPRIVIFAVGHVSGGVLWGLAAHFWTTMPDPNPSPTPAALPGPGRRGRRADDRGMAELGGILIRSTVGPPVIAGLIFLLGFLAGLAIVTFTGHTP